MNQALQALTQKTEKTIKAKERKTKRIKEQIKFYSWTILMVMAGVCYTISFYELQVFRADYLTATGHATRIIENRHSEVVTEQESNEAATIETSVSSEEITEIDTPRESKTVSMSAYTSHVNQTDASPCISADNTNICEYKGCVVASNDYPLGTKIAVDGFGTCTVKDRMNVRYTGTGNMDIYFGMDVDKALQFGRQEVKIAVVS